MHFNRNASLLKNYFNRVISNKNFVKYNIFKKKNNRDYVHLKKNKKSYIPDKNDYYEGSFDAYWP